MRVHDKITRFNVAMKNVLLVSICERVSDLLPRIGHPFVAILSLYCLVADNQIVTTSIGFCFLGRRSCRDIWSGWNIDGFVLAKRFTLENLADRLSVDEFHHVEVQPIVFASSEYAGDVGVV